MEAKDTVFQRIVRAVRDCAARASDLAELEEYTVDLIAERLPYYNWVGFYMLDPDDPAVLALGPFRSLIKDYQMLVDSHGHAVQEGRMERIQAIDMGRRGLHNEGAELMRARLQGKIDIDFDTARRLFTLVCVLHQRTAAL